MEKFGKFLLVLSLLCLLPVAPAVAENPINIPVISTVAVLKAIPVGAAPQYPNIEVQDYHGTGSGCQGIQY